MYSFEDFKTAVKNQSPTEIREFFESWAKQYTKGKKLLRKNRKMKKSVSDSDIALFNFSLPAYKTIWGKSVCPFAGACVKFCYAQKGAYIWNGPKISHHQNYVLTQRDDFADIMVNEISRKRGAVIVRIHDSGDFYSPKYLEKWVEIAKRSPKAKFYAYTNSLNMVRDLEVIPENMDFIFSDSGKLSHTINKETERHTKIFKTSESLLDQGYANAMENDLKATKWFNDTKLVGLVYH